MDEKKNVCLCIGFFSFFCIVTVGIQAGSIDKTGSSAGIVLVFYCGSNRPDFEGLIGPVFNKTVEQAAFSGLEQAAGNDNRPVALILIL